MAWELAIILVFLGIGISLIYLANNLDIRHTPIKLLFFIIALVMFLIGMNVTSNIVDVAASSHVNSTAWDHLRSQIDLSYTVLIWLMIIIFFYFALYFIITVIKNFAPTRQEKLKQRRRRRR